MASQLCAQFSLEAGFGGHREGSKGCATHREQVMASGPPPECEPLGLELDWSRVLAADSQLPLVELIAITALQNEIPDS